MIMYFLKIYDVVEDDHAGAEITKKTLNLFFIEILITNNYKKNSIIIIPSTGGAAAGAASGAGAGAAAGAATQNKTGQ